MDTNTLIVIIGLGALAGLVRAIFILANSVANTSRELDTSIIVGTLIRDIVVGGFAAALTWFLSEAMASQAGQILAALLAGAAGTQVTSMLLDSVGVRNERDLFERCA